MSARSPGLLASNPPPRWGAPGDDRAARARRRQARTRGTLPAVPRTTEPTRVDRPSDPATSTAAAAHRPPPLAPPADQPATPSPPGGHPVAAPPPARVGAGLRVPTLTAAVDYANLDHAASTPALVSVKAAVDTALRDLLLGPPRQRLGVPR